MPALVTERIVPPGGYETIKYAKTLGVTAGEVSTTKPAPNPERFSPAISDTKF